MVLSLLTLVSNAAAILNDPDGMEAKMLAEMIINRLALSLDIDTNAIDIMEFRRPADGMKETRRRLASKMVFIRNPLPSRASTQIRGSELEFPPWEASQLQKHRVWPNN